MMDLREYNFTFNNVNIDDPSFDEFLDVANQLINVKIEVNIFPSSSSSLKTKIKRIKRKKCDCKENTLVLTYPLGPEFVSPKQKINYTATTRIQQRIMEERQKEYEKYKHLDKLFEKLIKNEIKIEK